MTAKSLLNRIISIRKAIDYRQTKINALLERAESISSKMTGMPHNPSASQSPMADAVIKKVDLEREILELEEERKSLIAKIDLLKNDDYSRLLTMRFVQELTMEEISTEMGFCERHIYRVYKNALTALDEKLKDVMLCQ